MNIIYTAVLATLVKIPHALAVLGQQGPPEITGIGDRAKLVARYLFGLALTIGGGLYLVRGALNGKARFAHWGSFVSCLIAGYLITPPGEATAKAIIGWFGHG